MVCVNSPDRFLLGTSFGVIYIGSFVDLVMFKDCALLGGTGNAISPMKYIGIDWVHIIIYSCQIACHVLHLYVHMKLLLL